MDITLFLATNGLNGVIGIILLLAGYLAFDLCTPWKFERIFNSGQFTNGGLVIAAYLIGLALVIASAAG